MRDCLPLLFTADILIIGVFVLSWGISTLIYRIRRYDEIELNEAPHKRTEIMGDQIVSDEIVSSGD